MTIVTLRPHSTVDLGYTSAIGELIWDPEEQVLSIRGISGYSDLLATGSVRIDGHTYYAAAGCVIVEDWGGDRKLIGALINAGVLQRTERRDEQAALLEARVLTPADQVEDQAEPIIDPVTSPSLAPRI